MDQNLLYPHSKAAVQAFWKQRVNSDNPQFTGEQLRFYVSNNTMGKVSPGTPDRILRQLRQSGDLDYIILNRGLSLYKAVKLGTTSA